MRVYVWSESSGMAGEAPAWVLEFDGIAEEKDLEEFQGPPDFLLDVADLLEVRGTDWAERTADAIRRAVRRLQYGRLELQ